MVKDYLRYVIVGLLVPVLYVVSGLFGLLLFAVPPGYATLVFLPAGIAICTVCLYGMIALPGVFLGSFLLNLIIGYLNDAGIIGPVEISAAAWIAAASMLQAAVGGYLFRHIIEFRGLTLANIYNLLVLTMLTPLVCLVSATLSIMGLWSLGLVPTVKLTTNWIHWYIGDGIGVLIVMPWMLFFAAPLTENFKRKTIMRWTRDVLNGKVR